jgi:ABC-type antimicrobial peptide transport system permease subunit
LTQNIAWDGYQFSQQFSNDIAIISLIVGLILFILAAGMIGHFITIFIIDNKEITGILLALGASKQKIYKLYLWRSLIQIIVVVVTVIPILFLANGAMNNFILQFDTGIKIFYVNYVAVIMVFILCFILYFSCTLIPLSKFFKKDINNLIYNRV